MFTGRIGRLKFLGLIVVAYAVTIAAYAIALAVGFDTAAGEGGATAVALLLLAAGLAGLLISVSAWVRRFHDLNQSGWMALLVLVPLVGFFMLLYLLFAPGTPGENRYGPGTRAAARPAPAPWHDPWAERTHTHPQPGAAHTERPFAILAQGLDRNFRPSGSPEWIQLGSMTGREFARRASSLGPPGPAGHVPNVAFDREGVRLVLYQEDATVWHASDPPPGMTDRVAVHQIPEWLEAGITYAKRA